MAEQTPPVIPEAWLEHMTYWASHCSWCDTPHREPHRSYCPIIKPLVDWLQKEWRPDA